MSRVELQPCFVLHRRPFRDTSLIVDALTLDHGRVGLVARGARNSKKQLAGKLQPFRQLLVSWSGRGDLYTMTGLEEANSRTNPDGLRGTALFCGYYINELSVKLLPRDDPHPEVFAIYNQTLLELAASDQHVEPSLRRFEITLLGAIGYQLVLDHDVLNGKPILPEHNYHYIPDRGPVPSDHSTLDYGVGVSGSSLRSMAADDYSLPQTRDEARRLLRLLIDRQLDGRQLKSRSMYRSMQADLSSVEANTTDPGKGGR